MLKRGEQWKPCCYYHDDSHVEDLQASGPRGNGKANPELGSEMAKPSFLVQVQIPTVVC